MMKCQFVNLVLDSRNKNASFTMHGIKSSSLFHPKKQIKGRPLPSAPTSLVEAELPKPALSGRPFHPREDGGPIMFMPFGHGRDKILSADHGNNILFYGTCQNQICSMPRPKGWAANSIAITLGDALYLINRCPVEPNLHQPPFDHPFFQALINGEPPAEALGYVHSSKSKIGSSTDE